MFLAAAIASGWTGCSTLRFNNSGTLKYIFPIDVNPPVLVLKDDRTFIVQDINGEEWDSGEWRQERDTLMLMSDEYMPPYESLDTLTKEAVNLYLYKGVDPPGSWNLDNPHWQMWDKAVWVWRCKAQANDGYRDIYLIRGRHLYDGVYKTRAGYVRIKPKKRQADSNYSIE